MKIERNLNLVQTIKTDAGTYHIHSTPISLAIWEQYFDVLSQVYTKIFQGGIGAITGPKIAALSLKKFAKASGEWDGPEGVEQGLMGEIRRLTNVVLATGNGWETIPFEVAIARNLMDQEAVSEAENAIVFFICVSAVLRGPASLAKKQIVLAIMSRLWDAQTSSLNVTEYAASLPTSTPDESSTQPVQASSVPY